MKATNTHLGQEETSAYTELIATYTNPGVDVAPEIVIPPEDTVLIRGEPTATLQCIANARPLDELELVWLKDQVPIEQAGVAYSFNDLWNRTLSLLQADFSHAGVYTCRVGSRVGGPRLTAEAKVDVIGESNENNLCDKGQGQDRQKRPRLIGLFHGCSRKRKCDDKNADY